MRIGDFMKNRSGFTLIEIMGVIALLAVIMMVTVPTVLKTLKKSETNQFDTYVENLTLAAETYLQRNRERYPQMENVGGTLSVRVGTLQEEGFIKTHIKNPKTEADANPEDIIKITVESDGSYAFEYIQK